LELSGKDADSSDQGWPPLPALAETDDLELLKIRYQAVVDEVARLRKKVAEGEERETLEGWQRLRETQANEYLLNQAIHQARVDVAKASLERSYKAAEFVRNAAAAIVTLIRVFLEYLSPPVRMPGWDLCRRVGFWRLYSWLSQSFFRQPLWPSCSVPENLARQFQRRSCPIIRTGVSTRS